MIKATLFLKKYVMPNIPYVKGRAIRYYSLSPKNKVNPLCK